MEIGSEGESNRNMNDVNNTNNNNGQSDGSKKPKRQMKTPQQLLMLEQTYASEMYPSEAIRAKLSEDLGLTDRQLQMWFCHRRLKDKKEGDKKEGTPKRAIGEGSGGERTELMNSSRQGMMVVDRGGGSDHGSRSRSRHESWSRSGSGSGSESDSSQFEEPVVHSRAYELTQQKMMIRRIIECVEVQLGESLREDGPALGIEFDEPPPGAFGSPIVVKKRHSQARHSYDGSLFEQPDPRPIKEPVAHNIKHELYGSVSGLYDSPVVYPSDQRLVLQNGLPPAYAAPGQLKGASLLMPKGEMGHLPSPMNDNDFIQPNEEVLQMWRKRKSDDGVPGREGHSEKRMKKELEKKDLLRKKMEEQIKREMEKQDRERRKGEERLLRERQRQEERFQREERREMERREKFLQKESLKAERRRQKEEQRKEREAIKQKAAAEKAAARKIAKESMELIEDERLELLELAVSGKGLNSIVSLDYETLQNLDSFRDLLCVFPPKSVQERLKRPFSIHPWIDSEENVGNLLMVWRFCMTFADILGLWPFTLDEFVQALHDYDSRLLGEVHIALLRLIIRDIEDAARTPSGGPGTNQYTVANPEGGHPKIVEGAYNWGFDLRNWLKHLNPLTWPEVLRQFALSAGFGPQLKKDTTKCSGLTENDEGKGCEEVITMLRNGSAAENAATLMQEKGVHLQKKSRHRMTPGTVKFAAYHVLCLEGSKGLNVLELADKIQKTGLRDLTSSKTPDASISVALSRDPILFERIAPSTYCVRPAYRKDPATADEVISLAKEKIQTFTNGFLAGVNVEDVEKEEDYEEVAEGTEIDDFGASSTNKDNFFSEDVKMSVHKDVDADTKTDIKNAGAGVSSIDQGNIEIDEGKFGETWVQGLTEGEYSDLCVEERLNALVSLIGIANEGNIIRVVLEDRLDAATAVRKQMWAESQLDKRRMKEEFISKFQDSSFTVTAEGSQSPLIPIIDNKTNDGQLQTAPDGSMGQTTGQIHNSGYSTAERARLQLKAFIGHRAEEMYVYRSLPLGQDRRRNRYWQFVASSSRHDPGSGRIFVELQNGCWRLIDSEEAFDSLLLSLDTRGARESHLHIMLQKIEMSFKENIKRNSRTADRSSDSTACVSSSDSMEPSPSFNIELARNELETKNAMGRYQDLEKWMWKECLYSSSLAAMIHGKQRCTPLQGICDFCRATYCLDKAICPRCHRSFSTFNDKLRYLEPEGDVNVVNTNDWDINHPIRIRLIKSLLTFLEASVPSEALQSLWTDDNRKTWSSKLHASSLPLDLLQVLTWFESVIKRDFLSLNFETTEELLGISGLSENASSSSGSVPVLPWIPQTTAAVTLRLLELDGLISYTPEQKAELKMGDESTDVIVEKTPLKFTFLKNIGKTLDADHSKPLKLPRSGGGGRSRGGGKLQKRVAGPISIPGSSRPNVTFTISQAIKQQTHGTGRRTIRRKRIDKPPEEDPVRNFIVEEWIHNPHDRMETDNANFHVREEVSESDEDGEGHQVRFGMENGESSGYGVANNESGWGGKEISDEEGFEVEEDEEEDEDEIMNHGYVDGNVNDGRNFNADDSDSFDSGEYSD
uniref:homeobox-DDT domain protein RLT1 isoform X2 n=1 Tax=Erigeron canadensis TaxID=72917 RepID=UPI001CB89F8D|nr:homeobox-DDT domain protein RLT1 isoform X2 [Erigeron canadensis]